MAGCSQKGHPSTEPGEPAPGNPGLVFPPCVQPGVGSVGSPPGPPTGAGSISPSQNLGSPLQQKALAPHSHDSHGYWVMTISVSEPKRLEDGWFDESPE